MTVPISAKTTSNQKQKGNPNRDAAKFKKEQEILEEPLQLL